MRKKTQKQNKKVKVCLNWYHLEHEASTSHDGVDLVEIVGRTNLRWLVKQTTKTSEAHVISEVLEDLPVKLLRVYICPLGSVELLLRSIGSIGVKTCRSVGVVLFPLHLVPQHLNVEEWEK